MRRRLNHSQPGLLAPTIHVLKDRMAASKVSPLRSRNQKSTQTIKKSSKVQGRIWIRKNRKNRATRASSAKNLTGFMLLRQCQSPDVSKLAIGPIYHAPLPRYNRVGDIVNVVPAAVRRTVPKYRTCPFACCVLRTGPLAHFGFRDHRRCHV